MGMPGICKSCWSSIKIVIGFLILSIVTTLIYRFTPVPVTPLMIIRCVEQKSDGKPMKLSKDWKPLEEISSHLQLAVVCSEDQNFLLHYGFDFKALKKAMLNNEKSKKIRGGSTISQQTAKNVFLWNGRNYIRKGFEAYFTLLIETAWSKERIMEVYLNVIEMGNGIYGAEAAAQFYFNKPASKLTSAECAAIAAILPNPLKWNAIKRTPYIEKRKNWILRQMQHLRDGISEELFSDYETKR